MSPPKSVSCRKTSTRLSPLLSQLDLSPMVLRINTFTYARMRGKEPLLLSNQRLALCLKPPQSTHTQILSVERPQDSTSRNADSPDLRLSTNAQQQVLLNELQLMRQHTMVIKEKQDLFTLISTLSILSK